MGTYTEEAKDRCFGLFDDSAEKIWADIEEMPEDTTADKWRKKLNNIAKEYTFSSCFALMRIFLDRAGADDSMLIDKENPSAGFRFKIGEEADECELKDITMEHAESLTEEELEHFRQYLNGLASLQAGQTGHNQQEDEEIIRKALSPVKMKRGKLRTTLLTREEALRLGHMLQFTLQEMDWFLLRVFDNQEGFAYNLSNDLIEAYGFLSNYGWDHVEAIKIEYQRRCGGIPKMDADSKDNDWTKDAGNSLPDKVKEWSVHPDDKDDQFLIWMEQKAPYLDVASKTALRIYRNLAAYAYNLVKRKVRSLEPDKIRDRDGRTGTELYRRITALCDKDNYDDLTKRLLFVGENISEKACKEVRNVLLKENKEVYSREADLTISWRDNTQVKNNGGISVNDGLRESRERVNAILQGKIERIEKNDMLYLVWFIVNYCWSLSRNDITLQAANNRLLDFADIAQYCLEKAMLPDFYPPHLVERSMMLSVVYSYCSSENKYEDEYEDDGKKRIPVFAGHPAAVYEIACCAAKEERNRQRSM